MMMMMTMMTHQGYPGNYGKGSVIRNLGAANATAGTKVFHAGTAYGVGGEVVATGGRVLGVTSLAANVQVAQTTAYEALDKIDWPEGILFLPIPY
jgi:phosphoribosylamine--glycine ligase